MDEIKTIIEVINSLFPEPTDSYFDTAKMRNRYLSIPIDDSIKPFIELTIEIMKLPFSPKEKYPYSHLVSCSGGGSSFAVVNISAPDWHVIEQITPLLPYLPMKARMADLLWLERKKYKMALIAIDSYVEVFKANYCADVYWCFDYIQRAYVLSCQLGKSNNEYNKCCSVIESAITVLDKAAIDPYHIFRLMELLQENRYEVVNWGVEICDKILSRSNDDNDFGVFEQGIEAKIKWLKYYPQNDKLIRMENIRLARAYEGIAIRNVPNSVFRAIDLYEKALLIYRQSLCKEDEMRVRKLLNPLKEKLHTTLHKFSYSIDLTDRNKKLLSFFDDKTISEQLVLLGLNVVIMPKEYWKNLVIKELRDYPLAALWGASNILDSKGKTIVRIPSLDSSNPEKDTKLLELHMFHKASEFHSLFGQDVWRMLDLISEKQTIDESDLDFLLLDNFFVPQGRERKFKKGILFGIQKDYSLALDVLIPQFENALREFAEECGALVSTFDDDRTEKAMVLSSILNAPELVDAYDENILFCLAGLLNEGAGSNLRNMQAHGLLKDGNSPIYAYCWGVILRLLVMYSPKAHELMASFDNKICEPKNNTELNNDM